MLEKRTLAGVTRCPDCDGPLTFKDIDFRRPFACPSCGVKLWFPDSVANKLIAISVLISATVLLVIGVQLGILFVVLFLAGTIFIYVVLALYSIFLVRGAIERYWSGHLLG